MAKVSGFKCDKCGKLMEKLPDDFSVSFTYADSNLSYIVEVAFTQVGHATKPDLCSECQCDLIRNALATSYTKK